MSSLEEVIVDWFAANKRDLPWRNSTPWGVTVSEFMLQQTPVARVLPKWNEWMERWPTPQDLASATPAAKIIANDFDGEVPQTEESLRSLPGIGEYTAAAIAAFAYNERTLALDINIRRLFARVLDGMETPRANLSNYERTLRQELIPEKNAHVWAAATMELGALVSTSRNPKCGQCPLSTMCRWKAANYPKSGQPRKSQGWHGTDRQCRGVVVQALRDNASLKKTEIQILWHDESQMEKVLSTLLDDGLISISSNSAYTLPQNP
jgi:A/G-specific adenine glycosylase